MSTVWHISASSMAVKSSVMSWRPTTSEPSSVASGAPSVSVTVLLELVAVSAKVIAVGFMVVMRTGSEKVREMKFNSAPNVTENSAKRGVVTSVGEHSKSFQYKFNRKQPT